MCVKLLRVGYVCVCNSYLDTSISLHVSKYNSKRDSKREEVWCGLEGRMDGWMVGVSAAPLHIDVYVSYFSCQSRVFAPQIPSLCRLQLYNPCNYNLLYALGRV